MDEFARQLSINLKYQALKSNDWGDLFSTLAIETAKGMVIILFDEISWMGSKLLDCSGKLSSVLR